MARIRTIKPEFPQSESMGRVSREARLCFLLLWTLADDVGRLRGNSRMLASLLYPYDSDAPDLIDKWLAELDLEGCTRRYKIDGNIYIEICNWLKHQKIDNASKPKHPAPIEGSIILSSDRETVEKDSPGSRIKDQGSRIKESMSNCEVKKNTDDLPGGVQTVFEHWKSTFKHPKATLDGKRKKAITAALKSYSVEVLIESLSGYLNSPHHMGKNRQNTVYDEITLLLRDAAHIDAGLAFFKTPPKPTEPAVVNGQVLMSPEQIEARKLEKLTERRASLGAGYGFSMADFRTPFEGETSDQYRQAQDTEFNRRVAAIDSHKRKQAAITEEKP